HGGVRYLQQGNISLVMDALRERGLLLRLAAHVARPLPFIVPLYGGTRRPLGITLPPIARPLVPLGVRAGLLAYDMFARSRELRHWVLSRDRLEREAPDLRTDGLRRAFVYYDAKTDDVRLTHSVLATARIHGATTLNYAAAATLCSDGTQVIGALVADRLTGRSFEMPARFVVNATGIWAEELASLDGPPPFRIRHSKGVHAVLRPGAVRTSMAIVIPETDDGRLAFIVPWADRLILGTTDEHYEGDLEHPVATAAEVAYLLDHANRYLTRPLRRQDVTGTYAGIRPLVAAAAGETAALSRDHYLATSAGGLISITGGKLTTYRKMAEDTVDAIVARDGGARPCRTESIPLAGSMGLEQTRTALEAAALSPDQRAHLLDAYGSAAEAILALIRGDAALANRLADGLPVVAAEVVYACQAEQAVTLADCLYLRTRLAVLDADAGDRAAGRVADLMTRELGWDKDERQKQLALYEALRAKETLDAH
ncbi:MAG: glycerol-3-phosphate dehydrogenase/oxidase, partial [bacterium]